MVITEQQQQQQPQQQPQQQQQQPICIELLVTSPRKALRLFGE